MQQASNLSGNEYSYSPYIENLAKYIKEIEPNAELLIHQTWSYEKGANHYDWLPQYDGDPVKMFNALKSAYDKAAAKVGSLTLDNGMDVSLNKKPLKIIPAGKAFQNARANPIFDTTKGDGAVIRLNEGDGVHAGMYGEYLLGAVWYEVITRNKIADNTFIPAGFDDSVSDILKQAAHDAVVEYGLQ